MRYVLGETLQEYQEEIMEKDRPSVFLATSQTARDCLEQAGMQYEGQTIGISGDIADCQRLPGTGRHAV